MPVTIRREMTITRDDFFRILPKALDEFQFEINGNKVLCHIDNGHVEIDLTVAENRKIGALELPIMHVNFILNNISDEMRAKFFQNLIFHIIREEGSYLY